MSWTESKNAFLLISISSLFAFLLVEASFRAYLALEAQNESGRHNFRVMLYEKGDNFQNFENFFKYFPNKKIRSMTLYTTNNPKNSDDVVIEYDNTIETNNLGLVMTADVGTGHSVTYVIGNSYTQGQGAKPWFYELEKEHISKSQIVNLGILGTGPEQWYNLTEYITDENDLSVNGMVVNIIFDDLRRTPWILSETELTCLKEGVCPYRGYFQGIDFSEFKDVEQIRLNELTNVSKPLYDEEITLISILKKSKVLVGINRLIGPFGPPKNIRNQRFLEKLKLLANDNFFVNIVSDKTVNSENYYSQSSYPEFVSFLETNGIKYQWCHIPIEGFHLNDGHPNEFGYQFVKACTQTALNFLDD